MPSDSGDMGSETPNDSWENSGRRQARTVEQQRLSREELDQILDNALHNDDVLSNSEYEKEEEEEEDFDVTINEDDHVLLNQHYAMLKNQYVDYQMAGEKSTQVDVDSSEDERDDLTSQDEDLETAKSIIYTKTTEKRQQNAVKSYVNKSIFAILLFCILTTIYLCGPLISKTLTPVIPSWVPSGMNSLEFPPELLASEDLKKYMTDTFKYIQADLKRLNEKVQATEKQNGRHSQWQGQYVLNLSSKLQEINDILSEFQQGNEDLAKQVDLKFRQVDEQFKTVDAQLSSVNRTLKKFDEYKNKTDGIIQRLYNQVQNQSFVTFLDEHLPKYLPVSVSPENEISILPAFEDHIKYLIDQYVAGLNTTGLTQSIDKNRISQYVNELFTGNETTLVGLQHSSFGKLIKNEILKSLHQIKNPNLTKDENDRLIIDSTTEKVLSNLVKRIVDSNNSKYRAKYNYASYENGARIVSDLVSAYDSFNITELYTLQQQSKLVNKVRRLFIKDVKKADRNLVLNTYQAIFPNDYVAKDNNPSLNGHKTGIKTFAIKFAHPIYLTDLIISYPRFEKNAQMIYSAPKKISVWIQLNKPEQDLTKLNNYLYEITKSKYEDKYVVNLEKLEETIGTKKTKANKKFANEQPANSIPLKRLKTAEEVNYEKFYETNFKLFSQNFVKIGFMEYDVKSGVINQRFPTIDKGFKSLKVSVKSVFFAIESNYGDQYVTNLFKAKAYGISDFDLYCIKELLFRKDGPSNDSEGLLNNEQFDQYKDDIIKLDELFNEKYVSHLIYNEEETNQAEKPDLYQEEDDKEKDSELEYQYSDHQNGVSWMSNEDDVDYF